MSITAGRLTQLRKMKYEDYLKTDEWKKRRKGAVAFAGDRCQLCNSDKQPLNVHHRTYENLGAEMMQDLVALCRECHAKHHDKGDDPEQLGPIPFRDEWKDYAGEPHFVAATAWFVYGWQSAYQDMSRLEIWPEIDTVLPYVADAMRLAWDECFTSEPLCRWKASDVDCDACNTPAGEPCHGDYGDRLATAHTTRWEKSLAAKSASRIIDSDADDAAMTALVLALDKDPTILSHVIATREADRKKAAAEEKKAHGRGTKAASDAK